MTSMSKFRCLAFAVVAGLGLVFATGLTAQPIAPDLQPTTPYFPSPLVVVDSNGKLVGQLVDPFDTATEYSNVAANIDGQWTGFTVAPSGLVVFNGSIKIYFTNSNCSGQTYYMSATRLPLFGYIYGASQSVVSSGTLLFPVNPQQVTVSSALENITSLSPLTGTCMTLSQPDTDLFGIVQSAALGPFVPPFKIFTGSRLLQSAPQ
jgi:hypothetical protein